METSAQYERDLRSAGKSWKRDKDAHTKWAHGSRPLHGCGTDLVTGEASGGSETQRAKTRPKRPFEEHRPNKKHNIVKIMWGNYEQPHHSTRTAIAAMEELADAGDSRSIADMLLYPPMRRQVSTTTPADNTLYSFDSAQSPKRSMALDIFVKATGRETEKLVEREYEVLDARGDALKGRKARKSLRKASNPAALEEALEEDEGFELV